MPANRSLLNIEKQFFELYLNTSGTYNQNSLYQLDFLDLLKKNTNDDDIILYARIGNEESRGFFYTILVPNESLAFNSDISKLMEYHFQPDAQWHIRTSLSGEKRQTICSPLNDSNIPAMKNAEQIIFRRHCSYRIGNKTYFEISEKITQPHELHFNAESNSYRYLDNNGDVKAAIRIMNRDESELRSEIVTINKDLLKFHLKLTDCTAIRYFESFKIPGGFKNTPPLQKIIKKAKLYYQLSLFEDRQSIIRGIQLIPINAIKSPKEIKKKYIQFKTFNSKKNRMTKVSCDPKKISSSDISEMTYIFFEPGLLTKYKADTDEYIINQYYIERRNSWSIKYLSNKAHQIVVHLKDLSNLPYKEQQYWVLYNTKSDHEELNFALPTMDYTGKPSPGYEPLASFKCYIENTLRDKCDFWRLGDDTLINKLHYPATKAKDEWARAINILHKIVIEGLNRDYFAIKLEENKNVEKENNSKSITLLKKYIKKIKPDLRHEICNPLFELNDLRNDNSHLSDKNHHSKISTILKKHDDLLEHFKSLVKDCHRSLHLLMNIID